MAIKSFRHKGLARFFEDGDVRGIITAHAKKLANRLDRLDAATCYQDMNLPGYRLHLLEPKAKRRWAIDISGAWGITFEFVGFNVVVVDYEQYH